MCIIDVALCNCAGVVRVLCPVLEDQKKTSMHTPCLAVALIVVLAVQLVACTISQCSVGCIHQHSAFNTNSICVLELELWDGRRWAAFATHLPGYFTRWPPTQWREGELSTIGSPGFPPLGWKLNRGFHGVRPAVSFPWVRPSRDVPP